MRHAVPVDGRARARHVRRARDSDTAPLRPAPPRRGLPAAPLVSPARCLDHLVDALTEADGGDGQVVGCLGERLAHDAPPHLGGIEPELLRRLVDLHLERKTRLGRAVATLGATRRLVGEDARAFELVDRHLVGDGIDDAGVERGGHAVGAVGAAVEPRLDVGAGDFAVPGEPGLEPHEHRVSAAVHVENFLARQRDLHGAAGELRQLARRDLVGKRIELPSEAAAHRCSDHADVGGRHVEDLGEQAMDVVRRLRGRPQCELAVGPPLGHRRMLFHRQMSIALVEENVLAHEIGACERGFDVTELERDVLVHVRSVAVFVDAHLGMTERLLDRHERGQRLVLDLDQPAGRLGRLLVLGRHRRDGVADHPHALVAERLLVLGHGQDPELHPRQVGARDDGIDAWQRARAGCVDQLDQRVGMGRAQQLAVSHARHHEVVGVARLAHDLRPGVDLGQRPSDHGEFVLVHFRAPMRIEASSTASRIFV